jgi:hypothetical protein
VSLLVLLGLCLSFMLASSSRHNLSCYCFSDVVIVVVGGGVVLPVIVVGIVLALSFSFLLFLLLLLLLLSSALLCLLLLPPLLLLLLYWQVQSFVPVTVLGRTISLLSPAPICGNVHCLDF